MMAVTMLVALSVQAQVKVAKQMLRKSAATAQEATITPLKTKSVNKLQVNTLRQLSDAKQQNGQFPKRQVADKRRSPQRGLASHRVDASEATPVAIPYEANFAKNGDAFENDFIVINNNGDLSDFEPCTWLWNASSGAYYVYNTDGVTGADDYLVLPVTLKGGKTYEVTVNAATWNYPEEFEVVAGTACTAEAMVTTVIGRTTPVNDAADYTGTFTPESDGVYYVAIHCISQPDQYMLSVYGFSIDEQPSPQAPLAVSDFTVEQVTGELKATVSFTAPAESIGGDKLTDDVTVEVLRDGELVKTITNLAPGAKQTYTDAVPAEGTYTYRLVTYNAAGKGRASTEQKVKVMMPKDLPYIVSFDEEEAFDNFLVIDNNNDESTWEDNSGEGVAQYHYNWDNNGDDYLVTQPLRLQAGRKYEVTVKAAGFGAGYIERFDVVAGKKASADDLTIPVIESIELTTDIFNEYTGTFTADETGLYYVAVHATSLPNQYYLMVSGISVEACAEPTAPAAPLLTATAAPLGALEATIQVTAPTTTVEGNDLTAITKLELYRNGVLTDEQADVTPGAVVTFTDKSMETSGLYNYQAIAYNETGRGEKSEKTIVYVGLDQPVAPETVAAIDHANSVDLTWSAVGSEGMNGGYVNPDDVTYNVWDIDLSDFFVFFNEMMGSVKDDTKLSFDYPVDEGIEQTYKYFAVRPVNDATTDEDKADWNAAGVLVGKPYDAVFEGFADENFHYFWDTDASLAISNYSSDEDGTALTLLADTPGQKVFLSGKLNIKDATSPMLVFDALNASNIPTLYILGSVDQGKWNLLQTVTLSDKDYQTYQVSLANLKKHERYAQIAFVANYVNVVTEEDYGDYFFLDNIRIGDFLDDDLSVTAIAPSATLVAGTSQTIDVIVENTGLKPASGYTVKVMAGEVELLNETFADELAPFAKNYLQTELTTTVFDEAGVLPVTVNVDYAADQNTENNYIWADFTIEEPAVAAPEDLMATQTGNVVELAWTAPASQVEDVTEDFENGAGDFTLIDGNNDGFSWLYMYDDIYEELKCHSGYGGMQSYSYVPNVGAVEVDDWLVTPLAILDGEFSFWASAQDADWTDEHFAVYVSTTGNTSTNDFTLVSEEFVATGAPEEYTVDLSAYAGQEGYIAIRHYNSYDQFALVIDDISFTQAPILPVEYNVYVDQQFVATVEGNTTTYTVSGDLLTDDEHTFAVTAVYPSSKESRPATATITVTTGISQLAADNQPSNIYTLDGRRLSGKPSRAGIYICNGKKLTIK